MTYVETNEFNYELNEGNFTATVVYSEHISDDILIPYSITHLHYVYVVTSIGRGCFQSNSNIRSIVFPENSMVKKIENNAFQLSSIETICIPPKLTEFGNNVFEFCRQLRTINFPPNSPITSLGRDTFSDAIFEMFEIPSKVTILKSKTFYSCKELKFITFGPNSQLEKIEAEAIISCPIECIVIPQKVRKIEDSWFFDLQKVTKFSISPENPNFSVYNDQIMVGKNDQKSDTFDNFIISSRKVTKVNVPSYVKRISSSCFADCCSLQSIKITNDSKLEFIGKYSFYKCPIRYFFIPSNVTELGKYAFTDCKYLKTIEFQSNTKMNSIKNNVFSQSYFEGLIVPASVVSVGCYAFSNCYKLKSIEFLCDSIFTDRFCFDGSHSLTLISFPSASLICICGSECNEDLKIFTLNNINISAYFTPKNYANKNK